MKLTLERNVAFERERGRREIEAIFAPRLAAALSPVSPVHALKAAEADRFLVAAVKASPLLAPEAKARGISEVELAKLIRAKRDTKNAAVAAIEVRRQAAQAAIDAATSPAEIDAVIERVR